MKEVPATIAPEASTAVAKSDDQKQMEVIKEKFDPDKYNMIFHTSTVMDMLPAGVVMVPTVITIPQNELWDKAMDSKLSFLKDGMVELSAPAIKRIGMVAGVKLDKVDEEVKQVNGVSFLLIEYRASMLLPDGSVHSEVSGKEEAYQGQHAREKIDTKAKRNAIKALLNIPLSIPKANIDKPFIVLKPVFHRGYSPETDAIMDRIEGAKTYAMDMLYPGQSNQPKALTVNTSFTESGEQTCDDIIRMIQTAPDLTGLDALLKESADIPKTEAQRKAIISVYTERKNALQGSGEPKL